MVEGRYGHLHAQGHVNVIGDSRRGRRGELLAQLQLADALSNDLGVEAIETVALFQGLAHTRYRMLGE